MADGEVNAVLELGYADSIDDTHAELLECVAEAMGVAVRSAKYRIRLQELLEKTQQQAEELQSQSEELRTANEERESQSRCLQELQWRLEVHQTENEQSNAHIEEQTHAIEKKREDLNPA